MSEGDVGQIFGGEVGDEKDFPSLGFSEKGVDMGIFGGGDANFGGAGGERGVRAFETAEGLIDVI